MSSLSVSQGCHVYGMHFNFSLFMFLSSTKTKTTAPYLVPSSVKTRSLYFSSPWLIDVPLHSVDLWLFLLFLMYSKGHPSTIPPDKVLRDVEYYMIKRSQWITFNQISKAPLTNYMLFWEVLDACLMPADQQELRNDVPIRARALWAEQGLGKQIWRAIESQREPERARGSQRESDAWGSGRASQREPERAKSVVVQLYNPPRIFDIPQKIISFFNL